MVFGPGITNNVYSADKLKAEAVAQNATILASNSAAAPTVTTVPMIKDAPSGVDETGTKIEKKTAPKSKRTIDEAMSISYKDWDKMSIDKKQQKIIDHVTTVPKEQFEYLATKNQPDGRVGWLKSFLLNKDMKPEQSKLVVGALKKLNVSKEEFAELQAQGVDMAFDGDNLNRESCQMQVAEDMTAYGVKAQKVAVTKTSTSEFDSVKMAGASRASGLDKNIQADAVEQYMQGSKTSSKEFQKEIGLKLVDQYGQYAKCAEVQIHKTISSSDNSEVVEYAASNIWKFDKSNQMAAAQVTADTGNVRAINAAQAQQDKYDASVQAKIKENLASAESAAKEKAAEKSEAAGVKKSEEKETLAEKAEKVASNKSGNSEEVAKILKEATPEERKVLLAKLTPQARARAVLSLYGKIPMMDYLNALNELSTEEVSSDVSKQIAATISENGNTQKLSLLDSRLQVACVQSGKFTDVNPQNLSIMARYYLNKQTEGKKDLGWGIV